MLLALLPSAATSYTSTPLTAPLAELGGDVSETGLNCPRWLRSTEGKTALGALKKFQSIWNYRARETPSIKKKREYATAQYFDKVENHKPYKSANFLKGHGPIILYTGFMASVQQNAQWNKNGKNPFLKNERNQAELAQQVAAAYRTAILSDTKLGVLMNEVDICKPGHYTFQDWKDVSAAFVTAAMKSYSGNRGSRRNVIALSVVAKGGWHLGLAAGGTPGEFNKHSVFATAEAPQLVALGFGTTYFVKDHTELENAKSKRTLNKVPHTKMKSVVKAVATKGSFKPVLHG